MIVNLPVLPWTSAGTPLARLNRLICLDVHTHLCSTGYQLANVDEFHCVASIGICMGLSAHAQHAKVNARQDVGFMTLVLIQLLLCLLLPLLAVPQRSVLLALSALALIASQVLPCEDLQGRGAQPPIMVPHSGRKFSAQLLWSVQVPLSPLGWLLLSRPEVLDVALPLLPEGFHLMLCSQRDLILISGDVRLIPAQPHCCSAGLHQ